MLTEQSAVTGQERSTGHPAHDALIDFYRAFNGRDLGALQANWAAGEAPSMDNPIGGIRRGWDVIAEGYAKLFGGPARVYVEFYDYSSQGGAEHHLFVGRERGWCETPTGRLALKIRTSRMYVRDANIWRQLHHHGSIEDPKLLVAYQSAIFGHPVVTTT